MRTEQEILDRCFLILLVADRGLLERETHEGQTFTFEQREQQRKKFEDVFITRRFAEDIFRNEKRILSAGLGTLDEDTFAVTQMQYEAIPMLLWTLGMHDSPPYDGRLCAEDFHPLLGKQRKQELEVPNKRPSLREIEAAREVAMLWHWRCREGKNSELFLKEDAEVLVRKTFGPEYAAYMQSIPQSKKSPRDFMVGDKRFSGQSGRTITIVSQQALWRHHALEWVLGNDAWDETDTST